MLTKLSVIQRVRASRSVGSGADYSQWPGKHALSDNQCSSVINVINSRPHFSTLDNTYQQFMATSKVVSGSQIQAG